MQNPMSYFTGFLAVRLFPVSCYDKDATEFLGPGAEGLGRDGEGKHMGHALAILPTDTDKETIRLYN